MEIKATILTEPVAKGRPRTAVVNGHAHIYTPKKTAKSEAQIKADIRHTLGEVQSFPQGTPVRLVAVFYRPRPKGLSKKKTKPVTKPDCNNYLSLLQDALNKYAYFDDGQITTLMVAKRYVEPGGVPRIELSLEEDD